MLFSEQASIASRGCSRESVDPAEMDCAALGVVVLCDSEIERDGQLTRESERGSYKARPRHARKQTPI
jgi:hypothetical protein